MGKTFLPSSNNASSSLSKGVSLEYWKPFDDNKIVFVIVDENEDDGRSLWITDGTMDGTQPLKEHYCIEPRTKREISVLDEKIYFWASDSCNGTDSYYYYYYDTELWVSDGIADGTFKLRDINPNGSSSPSCCTRGKEKIAFFKNKTYFMTATEPEFRDSKQIWVTDGTTNGTQLAAFMDKFKVYESYVFEHISSTNNDGTLIIYVQNFDDGDVSNELWFSDGTYEGTLLQKSFAGSETSFRNMKATADDSGKLFFTAGNSLYTEDLWVTDGTIKGTQHVRSFDIFGGIGPNLMPNGKFMMWATDKFHGTELWATDGSPDGTVLVKDLLHGPESSFPRPIGRVGDDLFLQPEDMDDFQLWKSDGTTEGTKLVKKLYPDAPLDSYYQSGATVDDAIYFTVKNGVSELFDLWVSDGSYDGTMQIAVSDEFVRFEATTSGTIFFATTNGLATELWKITKSVPCSEEKSDKFFWKVNLQSGKNVVKTCNWLSKRNDIGKICSKTLAGAGYPPAREVCRITCETCETI